MKKKLSWWEYEHLLKDVDYTIIGSGIVGISTAIELKEEIPNCKVLVLDKKILPLGASTKNAGFACFGSISEIWEDYTTYGEKACEKLIAMRWKGLSILKSRVDRHKMMYQDKPGAEVFEKKEDRIFYSDKISWVNDLVAPIVKNDSCFYTNRGLFGDQIVNHLEGSLNPQRMMAELESIARNLGVIFISGIEVVNIHVKDKIVESKQGNISYKTLVVCTNGFSKDLLPELNIKPARNQVLITNRIPNFKLENCFHMNKGYVYFREYDGRLLLGGGRNLDEEGETSTELGTTDLIMDYLKTLIDDHILNGLAYTIEHSWSGILGVGDTKMPIVKEISEDTFVAIRMGGMGVAVGSFIGKATAGMVLSSGNSAYQLYVS